MSESFTSGRFLLRVATVTIWASIVTGYSPCLDNGIGPFQFMYWPVLVFITNNRCVVIADFVDCRDEIVCRCKVSFWCSTTLPTEVKSAVESPVGTHWYAFTNASSLLLSVLLLFFSKFLQTFKARNWFVSSERCSVARYRRGYSRRRLIWFIAFVRTDNLRLETGQFHVPSCFQLWFQVVLNNAIAEHVPRI